MCLKLYRKNGMYMGMMMIIIILMMMMSSASLVLSVSTLNNVLARYWESPFHSYG